MTGERATSPVPNIGWLYPNRRVRFVGGNPGLGWRGGDLGHVWDGETISEPIYANGEYWVRVRVLGQSDHVLVNLANIRP